MAGVVERCRTPRYIRAMTETPAGLLPILLVPNPLLRAKARLVTAADGDKLRELLPRMFDSMYQAPGIGLAAPQVGVGLRVAVVDLMTDDKPTPITLINPRVVTASPELATREEGCLSLPGQYADVERPGAGEGALSDAGRWQCRD